MIVDYRFLRIIVGRAMSTMMSPRIESTRYIRRVSVNDIGLSPF